MVGNAGLNCGLRSNLNTSKGSGFENNDCTDECVRKVATGRPRICSS